MLERFLANGGNQYLTNESKLLPLDPNSSEFQDLQFHFDTIFNDISQRSTSSEQKIYGIERGYSIKNQYISLNFQKREMNEITSYGWYLSGTNDDKKFEELIYKIKTKGQDEFSFEINISPPSGTSEDIHDIFICKFIVGESYILFQGDELEKSKEEIAENYDTIVRIVDNKTKKYEVLKPENIELLYLVKVKNSDFEPKTIQCSGNNCKLTEPGGDLLQPQDRKISFCLLNDNYLCRSCHVEYHQNQVLFGEFPPEICDKKPCIVNYQGDCDNQLAHQKKETVEFFCKTCNRGICSFCRFNGYEKHQDIQMITTLFSSCSFGEKNNTLKQIKEEFMHKTRAISDMITDIQTSNKQHANKLREIITIAIKKMFHESNDAFTKEGEKLLGMCFQINYLKDCMLNFHKLYEERENLLKGTKLKQELYWTKKIHFEHLLYLINTKENIKTSYKVEPKNFDKIINKYKKKYKNSLKIFQMMDEFGYKEIDKGKQTNELTSKYLAKEIGVNISKDGINKSGK